MTQSSSGRTIRLHGLVTREVDTLLRQYAKSRHISLAAAMNSLLGDALTQALARKD